MAQIRRKIIIGSNGNIALRLKQQYRDAEVVPRNKFLSWQHPQDLKSTFKKENYDIYLAIGVLSKLAPKQILERVNVEIPQLIAEIIQGTQSRMITFGSIMELDEEICNTNAYIASKKQLSEQLKSSMEREHFLHLRLHTLYGGKKLHSEMFLGQLFSAIRTKSTFYMSGGQQIREYHHIDDDLCALSLFLLNGYNGVREVTHNEVFTLKELAMAVLAHFKMSELLVVGEVETPSFEVFKPLGIKDELLNDLDFRPTLEGIIKDFNHRLESP